MFSTTAAHDMGGRGEAQALVAAALAEDEGVDAHQPALHVHERPPAAPGVDGGVGLQVDHGVVGPELPARAESTPMVTELSRPSGLPKASTI